MKRLFFSIFFGILSSCAFSNDGLVRIDHPLSVLDEVKAQYDNDSLQILCLDEKKCTRYGVNMKRVTTVYYADRASLQDVHNQFLLGLKLEEYGRKEGSAWVRGAADNGDVYAQMYVAKVFEDLGKYLDASNYYMKAARQGRADAVAKVWTTRAKAALKLGVGFSVAVAGMNIAAFMSSLNEVVGEEAVPGKKSAFSELPSRIANDMKEYMKLYHNYQEAAENYRLCDRENVKIESINDTTYYVTIGTGELFTIGKKSNGEYFTHQENKDAAGFLPQMLEMVFPNYPDRNSFDEAIYCILDDKKKEYSKAMEKNNYMEMKFDYNY